MKYFGSEKNRFQLEVAEGAAKKAGSKYTFTSARKGFKRFSTETTKELLRRQMQAEEARANALRDLRRRIFERFGSHYDEWNRAVSGMAQLDVLLAFAEYSRSEGETCIPVFDSSAKQVHIGLIYICILTGW